MTFSIAGMLALTTAVAVHVAFPVLVEILWVTLFYGTFPFFFIFVPLYILIAFSSESKNALNVGANPNLKRLWRGFAAFMIVLYLLMCILVPLSNMMVA